MAVFTLGSGTLDIYLLAIYVGAMSLKDTSYWILCALATGDAHGYAVSRHVEELSDGRVTLGPGTLYATLERLVTDGLIEEAGTEVVDGRNRRYYRLTGAGRRAAAEETERRTSAVARARTALGLA